MEGKNAYLVRPGDPKALADKLSFVLKHPRYAKEVGKSGRLLAENAFYYRVHAQRILDFVSELIARK